MSCSGFEKTTFEFSKARNQPKHEILNNQLWLVNTSHGKVIFNVEYIYIKWKLSGKTITISIMKALWQYNL